MYLFHQTISASSNIGCKVDQRARLGKTKRATVAGDNKILDDCGSVLEMNPLSTHFCTKMKFSPTSFDFMGVWIRKADLSSSCLIISTDQSHTNKVLVILKHLYGNFRFAKTGKRISSFKSPQINPNENYFKSLNLTGGEWQLLFPTLDITQTSSCSTTNLHSQVWS